MGIRDIRLFFFFFSARNGIQKKERRIMVMKNRERDRERVMKNMEKVRDMAEGGGENAKKKCARSCRYFWFSS